MKSPHFPAIALAFAPCLTGCSDWKAQWAYPRIEVGRTTQAQAVGMLPKDARLTTVSLAFLQEVKKPPMQNLTVCLLSPQGVVTGKLSVRVREEHWGVLKKSTAEVDAELLPFPGSNGSESGPVSQLRQVYDRLRRKQYDFHADAAHALACATVLRMLESLPGVLPGASDLQQYAASLAQIPSNGMVTIRTTGRQTYEFSYQASMSVRGKMTFGQEK
jgi:hypothetical protein